MNAHTAVTASATLSRLRPARVVKWVAVAMSGLAVCITIRKIMMIDTITD
jgi:hypothetical protein